jgi:hypothetical protein
MEKLSRIVVGLSLACACVALSGTSAASAPASRPSRPPVKWLAIRPGAPQFVQAWYDTISARKGRTLAAMRDQIKANEAEAKRINSLPAAMIEGGSDPFGSRSRHVDNAEMDRRKEEIGRLRGTNKELRLQIKAIEADNTWHEVPDLSYQLGAIGRIRALTVRQIVSPSEMIVVTSKGPLWLSGVDTSGLVDGANAAMPETFVIDGNRTYETAIGGSKTILHAVAIDLERWFYVTEDPQGELPTTQPSTQP